MQQSTGGIFLLLLQALIAQQPDAKLPQVGFKGQRRHEEHVGALLLPRAHPPCARHTALGRGCKSCNTHLADCGTDALRIASPLQKVWRCLRKLLPELP